jgi:hypothetical protein
MPKWLQGMIAPTLVLWFFAIAFGVAAALGADAGGMPRRAELASSVALPLVVALWVMADARKRGRRLCHDYDSLVYFAWPVVVPVYLFQTRGTRAFLTLLCFAGIWLIAALAAAVVFLIREFLL